jgi:23S rRNA pseudouridine1911/1915/1917 synthase
VHLAHVGAPLLGDARYGGPRQVGELAIPRVLLHAARLELPHPVTRERVHLETPLAADLQAFWDACAPA